MRDAVSVKFVQKPQASHWQFSLIYYLIENVSLPCCLCCYVVKRRFDRLFLGSIYIKPCYLGYNPQVLWFSPNHNYYDGAAGCGFQQVVANLM